KPESKTERYQQLERRFDELVQKQRETIVKDQMDQIYTKNGGEFMNAFTGEDQTGYYVRVPSNKLELWAWLESDRLLNPVFREFYSERDVVVEERRLRTESTPLGKLDEDINALFSEAQAGAPPTVRIAWKGVPFVHKDEDALDLLTDILSGRTGRLYKGLVLGRQVANEASGSVDPRKYAGIVEIECVVKEGKDPAAV